MVNVPLHDHAYVAALPDGDGGDPLIKWGPPAGRAMFGGSTGRSTYRNQVGSSDDIAGKWADFIGGLGIFENEMKLYYGNGFNLKDWAAANLPTNWEVNVSVPSGATGQSDFGQENDDDQATVDFMTWWISPVSGLAGASLQSTGGATQNAAAAVVDTETSRFTIEQYIPTSGFTNAHAHFLTEDIVQNAQLDFSSGNSGGAGTITSGLGNGVTQLNLVFTQADIFMDMTDATFNWNSSFAKPVPSVAMSPQIQVPIINPFHKTKYIIKAY